MPEVVKCKEEETNAHVVKTNDQTQVAKREATKSGGTVEKEECASEIPDEEADEEADEEENFLLNIENEEAKIKEEKSKHSHQPSAAADAPRLLQDALKSGDVKADESEEEEKKDEGAKEEVTDANDGQKAEHVHERVSC